MNWLQRSVWVICTCSHALCVWFKDDTVQACICVWNVQYLAWCISLCCLHEHVFHTTIHQRSDFFFTPAKVLKFFCTRWHCALGCENPPEHWDWIKAHKHHLWSLIDTVFLYFVFTPSGWLCCHGNRSKMGCTSQHAIIRSLPNVSKQRSPRMKLYSESELGRGPYQGQVRIH